ncbi:hypothetical protein Barb6XT_02683 [Bacteroidales bacterium Barb6XT]|nr:hypothetical protein Barb6XT_02683 [Bacteroidales bacterium Barb6XT]
MSRNAVARRIRPLHEMIARRRFRLYLHRRIIHVGAAPRLQPAVGGGRQLHLTVHVCRKLRLHLHVALHRKRIGIFARKTVARRICPLHKTMVSGGSSRQTRLRSVGMHPVIPAAASRSGFQVVCPDGYRIIIRNNRQSLPAVVRPVARVSVAFFRPLGNMNRTGSGHPVESAGCDDGRPVRQQRQGSQSRATAKGTRTDRPNSRGKRHFP